MLKVMHYHAMSVRNCIYPPLKDVKYKKSNGMKFWTMNIILCARQPVQRVDFQECFHSKMSKSQKRTELTSKPSLPISFHYLCVHWPFCPVQIMEPIMSITSFFSYTDCCLCCSETVMEQCQGNFLSVIFNLLNSKYHNSGLQYSMINIYSTLTNKQH